MLIEIAPKRSRGSVWQKANSLQKEEHLKAENIVNQMNIKKEENHIPGNNETVFETGPQSSSDTPFRNRM